MSATKPVSIASLLRKRRVPVVAIDDHGIFTFVNDAFFEAFGWEKEELIGNIITTIMPAHMRDSHNFGFSRFLTTEQSTIQGKPLRLPTLCKNGTIAQTVHLSIGEKQHGRWRFAATITPVKETEGTSLGT